MDPQDIFERYVWAGAITRDADVLAGMFTADGVLEAPLVPEGSPFPRRLVGPARIRTGLAAFYNRDDTGVDQTINMADSRYFLHTTTDPDVFIAEIDTAFDGPDGRTVTSLVQIFRLRDGKITSVRDYFDPGAVG